MLSPYCESIREKFNISISQVHKLIPTLNKKEKYVLHYRNLQLYTDLGLKVKKKLVAVHKIKETLTLIRLAYVGMCSLTRLNLGASCEGRCLN